MKQSDLLSLILNIFPKLYYSIPPIERFQVGVSPNKVRTLGESKIEINEYSAAILWLLETLENERRKEGLDYASQKELYKLVNHWVGWDVSRFSKELQKLLAAGLISRKISSADARSRELTLTTKGKKVLMKVKDQRIQIINYFIEGLGSEELAILGLALHKVADTAWRKVEKANLRKHR